MSSSTLTSAGDAIEALPLDFGQSVDDVTDCPTCGNLLRTPTTLPCQHTFCRSCLQRSIVDDDGDDEERQRRPFAACPLCRRPYRLPTGGIDAMPENVFVHRLVELRKLAFRSDLRQMLQCDVCSDENDYADATKTAAWHCDSCRKVLCRRCGKVHRTAATTRLHRMVDIDDGDDHFAVADASLLHPKNQPCYCDGHADRRLDLFCIDCAVPVCTECFAVGHRLHRIDDLERSARKLRERLQYDVDRVTTTCDERRREATRLERSRRRLVEGVAETRRAIVERSDELVRQILREKANLLRELEDVERCAYAELEKSADDVRRTMTMLEGFRRWARVVLEKAPAADVVRLGDGVHARADEMLDMSPCRVVSSPVIRFAPTEPLKAYPNILGAVVETNNVPGQIPNLDN